MAKKASEDKIEKQVYMAEEELTPHFIDVWFRAFYGKWIQNPDKTLEDNSIEGMELYNNMLRLDAQLGLCFRKRAGKVLSLGYDIQPAGESPAEQDQADFIRDVFDKVEKSHTSRRMFFQGIALGYKPAEIVFKMRPDGRIGIKRFCSRNAERFRFNQEENGDWKLIYVGRTQTKNEEMPGGKFLNNTWGSDETPYGQGLLRELYPLWYFKANAMKAFMRYTEKLGTPWVFGKAPEGATPEDRNILFEALEKMLGTHVGVGPAQSEIEFKEAKNQNVVSLFKFLISEYIDRQYAKAILGQTLSTESESGTFALAKFQSKGEQAIAEEDSIWQMAEFQPVVKTLIDINFGPQETYPRFVIPYEELKNIEAIGKGLKALVSIGVPITVGYALKETGLPVPEGVDETALLEIKQTGPFGGGNPLDSFDKPDEEQESGLMELSQKKKLTRRELAARRIAALGHLRQEAFEEGKKVYAGWIDKQIAQIRKAKSLTEIQHVWDPEINVKLAEHHAKAIRTATLQGQAFYYRDAFDQGLEAYVKEKGWTHVPTEVLALDKKASLQKLGPMTAGEAWREFRNKVPMTYKNFLAQDKLIQKKAFTVAHLENEYAVGKIKLEVERAIGSGKLLDDFVRDVRGVYKRAGLTPANAHHLETVYLTNVHGAANDARWAELQQDSAGLREFFPYLQYLTVGDDVVREDHIDLDGLVLRRDDQAWDSIYPIKDFNCRCQVVEVSVVDAEAENIQPAAGLPAGTTGPAPGFERTPIAA